MILISFLTPAFHEFFSFLGGGEQDIKWMEGLCASPVASGTPRSRGGNLCGNYEKP